MKLVHWHTHIYTVWRELGELSCAQTDRHTHTHTNTGVHNICSANGAQEITDSESEHLPQITS